MKCRACGHDNEREEGRCENCSFELSFQTLSLKEQRAGLQDALPSDGKEHPPSDLSLGRRNPAGVFGVVIVVLGLALTLFMVNTMERPERFLENGNHSGSLVDTIVVLQDTIPDIIGSDIVYVFDPSGQSATPRTNINLSLIPDGTTVSFLGQRELSIKPTVNFLMQKMGSRDFNILTVDRLCCWTDSTRTAFLEVSLIKPPRPVSADSLSLEPVDLRILFTATWIRGMVDEFNIDEIEPTVGLVYNESGFNTVLESVSRSLGRRDLGERIVQVTALFPDDTDLGQAMDILTEISPAVDSLGYEAFLIKYAIIED